MKKRVNVAYLLAISVITLGVTATIYNACSKVCAIRYISYLFDPQLSLTMRAAIEKQVRLLECDKKYQVSMIMQELARIFPDLKQIDITSLPYNMAEVEIRAPAPIIRINDSHVLTENQTIVPAAYYAHHTLKCLPEMHVSTQIAHTVSREMMDAIHKSIKEKIFERFMVSLQNEYEWYLHDKDDPLFTVCCNASCLPIGALYATYKQVKQEAKKRGLTKNTWTADVRFNHQIVLSRYKGGRNGKRI